MRQTYFPIRGKVQGTRHTGGVKTETEVKKEKRIEKKDNERDSDAITAKRKIGASS